MSSAAAKDLSDHEAMVAMSDAHKQPTREKPRPGHFARGVAAQPVPLALGYKFRGRAFAAFDKLLLDGIHYGHNNVLVQHFEATVARRRCQAVRIDASGLRGFAHIAPLISFPMSAAAVAGT